ncbi:MAG: DUF948 domain-containing protein [bacterium]
MILTISVTVIAITLLVLSIFLIQLLIQLKMTSQEIERLLTVVRIYVIPIRKDIEGIFDHVNVILDSANKQVNKMGEGLSNVKEISFQAREISDELIKLVKGIMYGVKIFFNTLHKD